MLCDEVFQLNSLFEKKAQYFLGDKAASLRQNSCTNKTYGVILRLYWFDYKDSHSEHFGCSYFSVYKIHCDDVFLQKLCTTFITYPT